MNSITHNPFRILGVFANDPLKARTANISRIRAFNKVGKECEFESDIKAVFGNIDRSEQAVEQAITLLSSEDEAEFYSCMWIHRTQRLNKTAKAPIDIIQSGIGGKDKSDIVNVLVGAILADNIQLSAEYLINLFECDDFPSDSVKERLIVTLGENFIDESLSLFPTVWWTQLRDYCNSEGGHNNSLSFIAKVFNKESMNYLRRVTEVIEKEKDTKFTTWSVFLTATKPIIDIIKETSDLHSKEPNAEAQIVLSEYAAASLSASKKYYENTRFWDASPVESLLENLREIYKISYSSKTKEECTEFGKKVKKELPYFAPSEVKSCSATIRKEVESFCAKPNETRWSLQLLQNCVSPLVEIKRLLGVDNPYYRRISTQIADNAIYACMSEIESAERKYNNPDNDRDVARDNLKRVLYQALQLHVNLTELDLEEGFTDTKRQKFKEKVVKISKRYGISIDMPNPSISLETQEDIYNRCDGYESLVEYVQYYPDSPHIQDAISRIWKIEDAKYPQLGTSIPSYIKALFAYKGLFPNSHNEQKLLKDIGDMLLGRSQLGEVQDYRTLLQLWPNHPRKNVVLGRLDLASFKQCHSVTEWEQYLRDFPNGQYRTQALGFIQAEKCNKEKAAFTNCVSVADYNRFIFLYPQSSLVKEAITKIEDLVYSQAIQTGKYDEYFKNYPNGRYSYKINQLLDDQCYNNCKTKKDHEEYLRLYPRGKHVNESKAFLKRKKRKKIALWVLCVVLIEVLGVIVIVNNNKNNNHSTEYSSHNEHHYSTTSSSDGQSYSNASGSNNSLSNENDFDGAASYTKNAPTSKSNKQSNYDPDAQYRYNSLETGDKPYREFFGRERTGQNYFFFKTSGKSDYVVIVKRHYDDVYINHIYISGGDNAYLYVPDGTFDVYFYSGQGWNPYKEVGNFVGGFVVGSMGKDGPVELESAYMEYTLYPVKHGNLRLESADVDEVFN